MVQSVSVGHPLAQRNRDGLEGKIVRDDRKEPGILGLHQEAESPGNGSKVMGQFPKDQLNCRITTVCKSEGTAGVKVS